MRRLVLPVAIALLGCAAPAHADADLPGAEPEAPALTASADLPKAELTPQILYKLLLAEVAAQRQQAATSTSLYLDLARATRDPRIARRAAEIGVHARQFDQALDAARLWVDLQPGDAFARQMLANLLAVTQRTDELSGIIKQELQSAGPAVGEAMMRLNRAFARYNDKAAVLRLVDQLTLPYLNLAEARFVRAQAALNAGDAMRAQNEIDEALTLKPDWEMAALFKSRQLPPSPATMAFITRWLAAHPDAKDMRLTYARALVGEKRFDEARTEFRTLLASFPDNLDIAFAVSVLALQLNDPAEASPLLQRIVDENGGKASIAHFYLGQIDEDAGRSDDAVKHYGAVGVGEQFVPARLRGAHLLAQQNRMVEARVWLKAGRDLSPDDAPRLVLAESHLLRERGEDGEAYAALQRALETHTDHDELLYEAGLVAERLRRLNDAEAHFRRLIAIKPDSPQGYNALGYSLADRGERLDEAESLIDKALALAPDDFYVLDSKGWVLFRRGKPELALDYLQRAYAAKPEPEVAAHVGEVLWALGKREQAESLWRDADKANPGNAELAATIKRFLP